MNLKKKHSFIFLLVFALFLLPSISALTITDTTFFASETNYTIFVDTLVLDNVTVTGASIQFHNVTSLGTNFTNTNATFDAVASFFGLNLSFTIFNVNTSVNLFTSSAGNQDFNATFTSGQVIRTIITIAIIPFGVSTTLTCNNVLGGFSTFFTFMPVIFTTLAIMILIFMFAGLLFIVINLKDPSGFNIDLSREGFITTLSSLGVLGFIGIIFVVILGFLCTI